MVNLIVQFIFLYLFWLNVEDDEKHGTPYYQKAVVHIKLNFLYIVECFGFVLKGMIWLIIFDLLKQCLWCIVVFKDIDLSSMLIVCSKETSILWKIHDCSILLTSKNWISNLLVLVSAYHHQSNWLPRTLIFVNVFKGFLQMLLFMSNSLDHPLIVLHQMIVHYLNRVVWVLLVDFWITYVKVF